MAEIPSRKPCPSIRPASAPQPMNTLEIKPASYRFKENKLLLLIKCWLLLFASLLCFGERIAAAAISTDRADYPPFSDVTINGSGFDPGEPLSVQIDQLDSDGSWTSVWVSDPGLVADDAGNFL